MVCPLVGGAGAGGKAPPQADHAIGRKQDDDEEAETDQGLKAPPIEADGDQCVERERAKDRVDDRADKRADWMAETEVQELYLGGGHG